MFLRHLSGFRSFSRKHGRISMGALEGSSNTNLREMSRRKPPLCVIVTLDPNKFAEKKQQRLHIGNLNSFTPYISLHKQSSPVRAHRLIYDQIGSTDCTVPRASPSFPPDTRAFLYYSVPPEKTRIAGELRLRIASSDDLASFESGSDLLLTNGQPWLRPLYSLSKYYSVLYEKLREDRLVPDDLDAVLSTLPSKEHRYRRSHLHYTLNDTFIIDFSSSALTFVVITEQGVEKLKLDYLFSDKRKMCSGTPYTGTALGRFERSTLPDHKGTRTVVLRFLKIITPVKCVMPHYDGYISCPKEGDLHRRRHRIHNQSVWSVNIDTSKGLMARGLQLLWDA